MPKHDYRKEASELANGIAGDAFVLMVRDELEKTLRRTAARSYRDVVELMASIRDHLGFSDNHGVRTFLAALEKQLIEMAKRTEARH